MSTTPTGVVRSPANPAPAVLVIMKAGSRRLRLLRAFENLGVRALAAGGCRQAERVLATGAALQIVISDIEYGDGDWRQSLAAVQQSAPSALFLVSAPRAGDDLWSQILWRGGYDVLVEPYTLSDLQRLLDSARRADQRLTAAASATA